jgi:hypothetical protein
VWILYWQGSLNSVQLGELSIGMCFSAACNSHQQFCCSLPEHGQEDKISQHLVRRILMYEGGVMRFLQLKRCFKVVFAELLESLVSI